jgi:fatty-acyl-CoA synthase
MIVSGGENVFPQEVEELLARHEAVADVAVVGVPDEEFGQRLAAYVVPVPGSAVDADALRDHVRTNLARYKVPRTVRFVEELPRNATGKVVTRQLDP